MLKKTKGIRCFTLTLLILLWGCSSVLMGQFNCIEILGGKEKISIPFEYKEGFIIVKIGLNNALPLNFIFDTGAENTVLLEKIYAKLMGLGLNEKINIIGADNSSLNVAYISRRVPLSFQVGGSFVTDILVLEENKIDFNNIIGEKIDGIIGGNVFVGAVIEIDYRKQLITFHKSETFLKPKKFHEERIEILRNRPFIKAEVSVSGRTEADLKLLMDTGAGLHLLIDEQSHPGVEMPDSVIDGRIGEGLGGNLGGFLGNVEKFNLMNEKYSNIPVYFQRMDPEFLEISMENRRNGIIGNIYWQSNKVIIDYARQKLYTKPYRKKKKKFRFNKSGLVVFAAGEDLEEYIIKYVAKGSPADRAGLKPGDLILSFNRVPSQFVSLHFINKKLSGDQGDTIRVRVKRRGDKLDFAFLLKSNKISL